MKKLVTVILIYIFYFNSITTAYAANVGGWSISNPVAQGASTVYDATKNVVINGKDFVKDSWVKIKPTASQVSKVLARGGAGYALSVAVEQLLGAVDWVLDPANNRIIYSPQYGGRDLALYRPRCLADVEAYLAKYPTIPKYWPTNTYQVNFKANNQNANIVECRTYLYSGDSTRRLIAEYPITGEEGEKYLPLDVVASKVISNAESSSDEQIKVGAQVATSAAAADIVAEAETDQSKARPIASQAEANAETKPADEDAAANANSGAATATPQADPVTGEQAPPTDIALEFPVFCNWAPSVCEAAQVVISFPQTLTGWWETANQKADQWVNSISEAWQQVRDYFKEEAPPNDSTEVEFVEPVPPVVDAPSFSWNAYCPFSARTDQISVDGNTVSLESDLTSWCEMAVEVRPFILFAGAWISYLIISGFRMGGD